MHEMREMRERNPLSAAEAIGRCLTAILILVAKSYEVYR